MKNKFLAICLVVQIIIIAGVLFVIFSDPKKEVPVTPPASPAPAQTTPTLSTITIEAPQQEEVGYIITPAEYLICNFDITDATPKLKYLQKQKNNVVDISNYKITQHRSGHKNSQLCVLCNLELKKATRDLLDRLNKKTERYYGHMAATAMISAPFYKRHAILVSLTQTAVVIEERERVEKVIGDGIALFDKYEGLLVKLFNSLCEHLDDTDYNNPNYVNSLGLGDL